MPDRNSDRDRPPRGHELFAQHLAELKLSRIAETYREVLDEAARKNTPPLDVLAALVADEVSARRERALQRRIEQAKLPPNAPKGPGLPFSEIASNDSSQPKS